MNNIKLFNCLEQYKSKGNFSFNFIRSYKESCNAPSDKSGVYLMFKIVDGKEELIYIGSSGQKNKEGKLKTRVGGLRDRLINGYHPNQFGQIKRIKRNIALPQQMQFEKISELKIYWWITYDHEIEHFPTDVETILRNLYIEEHGRLPSWHN